MVRLGQVGNVRFGQLDLHRLSPLAWLQLCSIMLLRYCYLFWELSIVYYILLLVAACNQIQFWTPHLALHYLTNVHILNDLTREPWRLSLSRALNKPYFVNKSNFEYWKMNRTNIWIFDIFWKCHHLFDFQFWPPDNNKNALPTPYTANEKTNVHNLYSVYPSFSPNLGVKSLVHCTSRPIQVIYRVQIVD